MNQTVNKEEEESKKPNKKKIRNFVFCSLHRSNKKEGFVWAADEFVSGCFVIIVIFLFHFPGFNLFFMAFNKSKVYLFQF